MDRVCRVCMSPVDLVDMFAEGKLPECELTLAEMLNECVKYQVKPEDKLTKKICRSCVSDLKIAYRLKCNAENSQKRLNIRLQETDLEEFIDTLEAEDWELMQDPIKKELDDTSELKVHLESTQESHNIIKKKQNSKSSFNCNICGKIFNKIGQLMMHLRTHTGERPFKCTICQKSFTQRSILATHQLVHTSERKYKCPHCSKDFKQKQGLVKHLHKHVLTIETKSIQESLHLIKDIPISKEFKCKTCVKTFKTSTKLTVHIRTHTGERPFKCSKCPRSFADPSAFKRHLIVHTGERMFKCPHCPKDFTLKQGLVRHLPKHASTKEDKIKLDNKKKQSVQIKPKNRFLLSNC